MATDQVTTNEGALEILKRLEPVLTSIDVRLTVIETQQRAMGQDVANLQGRVSQIPTSWQMITAILAMIFTIMGGTAAILFAALNYAKP